MLDKLERFFTEKGGYGQRFLCSSGASASLSDLPRPLPLQASSGIRDGEWRSSIVPPGPPRGPKTL